MRQEARLFTWVAVTAALDVEIDKLTVIIDQLILALPLAHTDTGGPLTATCLSVLERLDEIRGVGPRVAQIIIAETGPR